MTTEPDTNSPNRPGRNIFTNPAVSITLSVLLTVALKLLVEWTWTYLTGFWHLWSLTVIATLLVSLGGVALFLFRKRFQAYYGQLEVGFALVVIWTSIAKAQTTGDITSGIAVVAGAYLIVRGLTNYYEGKKGIA